MSKFNIILSYKNACIVKHALKNKIAEKESWIQANSDGIENYEDERKELEEEKRALESLTNEIDRNKAKHNFIEQQVNQDKIKGIPKNLEIPLRK